MQLPGEFSPFIEKKVVFCLVVGGVTPPYTLSGPTTKKTLFLCVSSLIGGKYDQKGTKKVTNQFFLLDFPPQYKTFFGL